MHKKTALVAEDDSAMLEMLKAVLWSDGFFTQSSTDGRHLFDLIKKAQDKKSLPDLIITDHRMPELTGYQVIRWLRQHHIDVPVIFLTAFGSEVLKQRVKTLGNVYIMDKPFELKKFREMLHQINQTHKTAIRA